MNTVKCCIGLGSMLWALVAETSAITVNVTVSNTPPNYTGAPVAISGSAWYSAPLSMPVQGGTATLTLAGVTTSTYTIVDGTYSALVGPVAAGVHTARVCVSDGSVSNCANQVVTVTTAKADQTITFPAIGDKYANATVGLSATASSGLPVSFAVGSGPGAIANGTNLTFTGTGLVSIVAVQAGNASWNPAPNVTNSFTVRTPVVMQITTPVLPVGTNTIPYSTLLQATGGVPPFAWSVQPCLALSAWGSDQYGQVTAIGGLSNLLAISAGKQHSLALKIDGTVVAWGYGGEGRTTVPAGLSNVVKIAAGGFHNMVLRSDGTVVGWGRSTEGQVTPPPGLTGVVAVAAGGFHSLALRSDGTVAVWSTDGSGQTNIPPGLAGVVAISAGYYHSLALQSNGTVVAWGGTGQNPPAGLSNVVAISAGSFDNLALKSDGTVFKWGLSGQEQLSLTDVMAVSAGDGFYLALKSDSTVVAWGSNGSGQTSVPPGLTGVVAIAAGGDHALALRETPPLPEGLSFSTNGTLSGTPVSAGSSLMTFAVQDAYGAATSRWLELVIHPITLSAPEALEATNITATGFSANWNASAGATNYLLDVSPYTTFGVMLPGYDNLSVGNVLTRPVTGLSPNQPYFYRVRAQRTAEISPDSDIITVITLKSNQTITFPPIGDKHVTDTVGLAATASSGLPVSFAVGSGPGTIANGTNLTFTGTGLVSIVASQAGNYSWNPAPNITNTFTVTAAKSDQTIDFPPIGNKLTTDTVGLAATASSGLPVSFAVSSGPATIADGTNLSFTGAGTVSIVASQAGDAQWNPAPDVTQTFEVTVADVMATVLLDNLQHLYDGTPKSATATTIPPGLAVEITYDGMSFAPTMPGMYAVVATVIEPHYAGATNDYLSIEGLAVPTGVFATPTLTHPATRAMVSWGQSQGRNALITVAPSWPWGAPQDGTPYSPNDTFGNQTVVLGSTTDKPVEAPGLTPGQTYYVTVYAENNYHYSAGSPPAEVVMGRPQVRNTSGGMPEMPVDVYLGDTGMVFGCDAWGTLESNEGRARVWVAPPFTMDFQTQGIAGPWSPSHSFEHKFSTSGGVFHQLGWWQWAVQLDYGWPHGDSFWYAGVSASWADAWPSPPGIALPVEVKPIENPANMMMGTGPVPHQELELQCAPNARGNPVMIARRPAAAPRVDPPQGMSVWNGYVLGDGQVIYLGPAMALTDRGLAPDTDYIYTFYSVNNDYYSPGSEMWMRTAPCPVTAPAMLTAEAAATSFTLQWGPAFFATNYLLDVATDAGFTAFVAGYDNLAVGDVGSWAVTGLTPGQTYYCRVRAQSECGFSDYSSPLEVVTTGGATVDRFVALAGGNVAPYTNWADAAHRIQDAIDAAGSGETVWVSNGVFEGNVSFNGKSIRVASLFAQSGNPTDIETTVIRGTGSGSVVTFTNNETAAAMLIGFTVSNGNANGTAHPFERGGGIRCRNASPRLEHLRVVGNHARHVGGGLYFEYSQSSLRNVFASGNTAEGGAGAACYGAAPSLVNLTLRGNHATSAGGGLMLYHATPVLRNLLVAGNTAAEKGGGLYFDASSPVIENLTCVSNAALYGGGLNISYSSYPQLLNSIVWGNEPQQIEYDTRWYYMSVSLNHVILQGGTNAVLTHGLGHVYTLGSVLDADPLFADSDYRLAPASPGRDSGSNQAWMTTDTDIDAQPRIQAGTVDRGAYEAGSAAAAGSLRCTIQPPAVRSLGARWRVTSGPYTGWNESGVTLYNLPPGPCTVEFQAVPGWSTPANTQPVIVAGVETALSATYAATVPDAQPPVIGSVLPVNGHVTRSNTLALAIAATDNQSIAKVTVNGRDATPAGPGLWSFDLEGLRGPYNDVTIQAFDTAGLITATNLAYVRADDLQFHAVHAGLWRVRNPWPTAYSLAWQAVETSESDAGILAPNSDFLFTTSLQVSNVNLFIDGQPFGSAPASPAPAPAEPGNEAELDSDGDGMSNEDEAFAATDPFSAASVFQLQPAGAGSGRRRDGAQVIFAFGWDSSADNAYAVETSRDLFDWAVVPDFDGRRGTGAGMGYTNNAPDTLYFRLRTWPWDVAP